MLNRIEQVERIFMGTSVLVEGQAQAGPGSLCGCDNGFGQLAEKHWAFLYDVAYRVLHSHENAEDAVQEGLLKAFRAYSQGSRERRRTLSEQAWLREIVRNTALNLSRHERKLSIMSLDASEEDKYFGIVDTAHEMPEVAILRDEIYEEFCDLIGDLPVLSRLFLWYRFIEGYQYNRIMEVVEQGESLKGIGVEALRKRVSRGVEMLRKALALRDISLSDLDAWTGWSEVFDTPMPMRQTSPERWQSLSSYLRSIESDLVSG